jgi:helicase required for RNAi-mediated heterochromatin assembly 1
MLGDNAQLKPSPTTYSLSRQYNRDVSLFERLINNNIEYAPLKTQYRILPQITTLLKEFYLFDLENCPSERKMITGFAKNCFLLNHTHPENDSDNGHRSNETEAELVMEIFHRLYKQGYDQKKITAISMYSEQSRLIYKKLKSKNLKKIVSTTVDNFQGRENDYIVLSLVL